MTDFRQLLPQSGQGGLFFQEALLFGFREESGGDGVGAEPEIGGVLSQKQPILRPAGEHAVGFRRAAGHEIINQHADIGFIAREDEVAFSSEAAGGIDSRHESLGGGLFVARSAIDLSGEVEARDAFGFQGAVELGWGAVVVFDGIARAEDFAGFEPLNRAEEGQLDRIGQARRDPVDVKFPGMEALRFQKDRMGGFFRKPHDLILDGRAIARADSFDDPAIHRGFVQVSPDDFVGFGVRSRQPAGNLFHVEHSIPPGIEGKEIVGVFFEEFGPVGEERGGRIAVLAGEGGEINASCEEASRGAGFEAFDGKAQFAEAITEGRGAIAHSAPGLLAKADVEESTEEGARGDHNRAGEVAEGEGGFEADDLIVFNKEAGDIALLEIEVRGVFQEGFEAELVGFFIALGAGGADARAFGSVEEAELDGCRVGIFGHDATEGIDFAHDVAFCQSANGRIAGHLADGVRILGEEKGRATEAGGGESGLHTGVTRSNDGDIVGFRIDEIAQSRGRMVSRA